MSLIVDQEKSVFEVVLCFTPKDNGDIEFHEPANAPDGAKTEKFVFRRPTWRDARVIMERSMIPGGENVDAIAYMDAKVRTLLKSWSLKDEAGGVLPIAKFDSLSPAVILKLSTLVDAQLGGAGIMGISAS